MLHFVYRRDMMNAGDQASCPMRYFHWPMPIREHDIDDLDFRWFRESDVAIIGGGGLFDCSEKWNRVINGILDRCGKVIAWGVGFNSQSAEKPKERIDFARFSILTTRDKGHPSRYEWLPCVSCMAIDDSFVDSTGSGVGTVSHRDHIIKKDGDFILNSESPSRILGFILKHDEVVTNSYHAAYWAGLLGRKVVLKDTGYSDKFQWLAPIDLCTAKDMNRALYRQVINCITT